MFKIKECRKIMKQCSTCKKIKTIKNFDKRKKGSLDGYYGRCRECIKKKVLERANKNKGEITEKYCKKCNTTKPISEFHKDKFSKDGYNIICKECVFKKYKKVCKRCGKEFYTNHKQAVFCGFKCMNENKTEESNVTFKCEVCGKETTYKKSHYDFCKHHYCSKKCSNIGHGKIYSGKNHPNYKEWLTDEDREDRRNIKGYKEWIYKVKEKYNFQCQCCGDNKGHNLVSHHLNSYDWDKEHRTDINNGVCLCDKCHKKFHDIYGYGKNNKEQYIEFIKIYANQTGRLELKD